MFGSLQGWGKIFHDMAVIMVKIWGTYGEHEVLSHHCLVVSNFFLCLFFEKAIEMGDSPKTQDPIDLSNSMWESYPCHKPTSFGDGFYMHKMVMTWGWWHWALGFPHCVARSSPRASWMRRNCRKILGWGTQRRGHCWSLLAHSFIIPAS